MDINLHVWFHDSAAVQGRLDAIDLRLSALFKQGATIMAAIDDLETKEAALEGSVSSMATLLGVIHGELVAAIAANDPARIQAVADKLGNLKTSVDAAVAGNPDPQAVPPNPPL